MELFVLLLLVLLLTLVALLIGKLTPARLPPAPGLIFLQNKLQKYSTRLILIFALMMVVTIFGRVAAAKWNLIDDHEIMLFLGPDGKLPPGEIASAFSLTEIGNFGSLDRFRPSYYFLRILETSVWGANPLFWHSTRLVLLWLAISLIWILVQPYMGWLGGGVLCAYILTFSFWPDTMGRLGAGETYAVIGLPLYLWGMVAAFRETMDRKGQALAGTSILVGSMLCTGSKENFLLLLLPSAYLMLKAYQSRRYILLLFVTGSVIFTLFVGTAVYLLLSRSGMDVYANPISPAARLSSFLNAVSSGDNFISIVLLTILTLSLGVAAFFSDVPDNAKTILRNSMFWFVVLLGIYFSQLFFYNGAWPVGSRYDFPGVLYLPAAVFLLYLLAEKLLAEEPSARLPRSGVRAVFVGALFLMILIKGYEKTFLLLDQVVAESNRFTDGVEHMASLVKRNPDAAIVIESHKVREYEPVFSYERFLRAHGVQNPMFLRISCYSPETMQSGLAKSLSTKLMDMSIRGNDHFNPLAQLAEYEGRCYTLNLTNSTLEKCSASGIEPVECP